MLSRQMDADRHKGHRMEYDSFRRDFMRKAMLIRKNERGNSGIFIVEVAKLIAQLRDYQKDVDRAIQVLQKLADQRAGRAAVGKRQVNADTRRKMAAAQKKRWEKFRNENGSE
jgi:hypothetical protein